MSLCTTELSGIIVLYCLTREPIRLLKFGISFDECITKNECTPIYKYKCNRHICRRPMCLLSFWLFCLLLLVKSYRKLVKKCLQCVLLLFFDLNNQCQTQKHSKHTWPVFLHLGKLYICIDEPDMRADLNRPAFNKKTNTIIYKVVIINT